MSKTKTFDCVQFQRDVREQMLKEADYDLSKLVENVKNHLKSNELYHYLMEKKAKSKQLELA